MPISTGAKAAVRSLYFFLILLLFEPLPAKANRLTDSDFEAAMAINRTLYTALRDLAETGRDMQVFSANTYCVDGVLNDLLTLQLNMQHLTTLISIDLRISEADEENIKETMKIATDGMVTEFKTLRGGLNRALGVCSKYPLPIAKAQQALQILDRANSLVKSISSRW